MYHFTTCTNDNSTCKSSGGIKLTVSGENLDSVANPWLEVTISENESGDGQTGTNENNRTLTQILDLPMTLKEASKHHEFVLRNERHYSLPTDIVFIDLHPECL